MRRYIAIHFFLAVWVIHFLAVAAIAQLISPKAKVVGGGGPDMSTAQSEAYNGPKARIAVFRFTDKTGKGW